MTQAPETMILAGQLADPSAWKPRDCSVARALEIVGTRSAMLLMREAYFGVRRFEEFARRVGISDAVAAARLRELVEAGLLLRRPYQEPGRRTREEYVLTAMGRDLLPAIVALMQWGDRWLAGAEGGPVELSHAGCGAEVTAELRCAAGHQVRIAEISTRLRESGRRHPKG